MAITHYILLAAASLLPALATSAGRCFREKDLISFSLFSLWYLGSNYDKCLLPSRLYDGFTLQIWTIHP